MQLLKISLSFNVSISLYLSRPLANPAVKSSPAFRKLLPGYDYFPYVLTLSHEDDVGGYASKLPALRSQ